NRMVETISATHHYVVELADVERTQLQGPCLSAAWDDPVSRIADLATESRWPCYRDAALARTPIRSILGIRMFAGTKTAKTTGVLAVYADQPQAFEDESTELGLLFAAHTALVWEIVRRSEQFHGALASRDIIGQAKGMLMERFNITAVQAFDLLTKLSQNSNTPVAQIARRLVYADHPPQ
ncbi:MAG: GAF and ANTAR domain-containing protein, partial [Mycobacteriaceae bacterium]|nr:GAF and ANTAR domain-containing protein [Mycobacteriaceae bacterium]